MTAQPLTADRRLLLQRAVDLNDRDGYYSLLKSYGYAYGELALGVVSKTTVNGVTANGFARSVAESQGVYLSDIRWRQLSIDLMKSDWARRKELPVGSSDDLRWSEYRDYHQDVFSVYRLPGTADRGWWTEQRSV